MSNKLQCLSDASSFLNQVLQKEPSYNYPTNDKCLNSSVPQDENVYMKDVEQACKMTPKQGLCRKREANNILMECVKRRDSLRSGDSPLDVPYDSLITLTESVLGASAFLRTGSEPYWQSSKEGSDEDASGNADFSDSSGADSGIGCSKSCSPVHSVETSSTSGLDDDISQNLMDIDGIETSVSSSSDGLCPKSVATSAADDLNELHLTDTASTTSSDEIEIKAKSPFIQSLFKHVPSMIYFSVRNEAVSAMPEHILSTLNWKLSTVSPVVIRQTVKRAGFSLIEVESTEDWLGTWGKYPKSSFYKRLKRYQKVNHFPGGYQIGRKDRLWQNYNKMLHRHGSTDFNFFPETFILPADLKALKDAWGDKCWIVKPCAAARGSGVEVVYKWSQVPKDKPNVVQRYIGDPYLINGSKFDLRLYVLISSIEPLRVYLFEDGLVRFASEKYSLANKSFANRYIHLTNYSINRKSSSYTSNDDENKCQGHKWSLKSFWKYMANSGIDTQKIQTAIVDMIIKTILCAEGPICRLSKSHSRIAYNCFEIFGFDIMLDKDLHPWLLEVNISPSLHTRSKLDSKIKGVLVRDLLNIVGFEVPVRKEISINECRSKAVSNRHKPYRNRWFSPEEKTKHAVYSFSHSEVETEILENLTPDDLHCLIESEDELQRKGSFTRIFPTGDTHHYFPYFDHIRYYNVLLDAWERKYHSRRDEGIKLLQDLYEKMLQPHDNVENSAELNTKNGA